MEALGKLGFNLAGLISQIINFVILLGLLSVLAYKPITKMLDQRAARIRESMENSELIKQQAARAEQEFQARVEAGRAEGQALIAQAREVGERLKEEARQDAQREAESLMAKARADIQRERDEAMAELRRQFAALVILASEKVINQSLDKSAHMRLIDEVLEQSSLRDS